MAIGLKYVDTSPIRQAVTICNRRGLHARAAALFVRRSSAFKSQVGVTRGGQTVSGHSILGLMMLAAAMGSEIEISVHGPDADDALKSLSALVLSGFEEN